MQALGFIETKGLLAAIECADAMLKAAEVTLIERTKVGGGLVTITVSGDVAAVRAAVDAGVAAVERIDKALLISQHVIPRPHEEVAGLVDKVSPPKNAGEEEVPAEPEEDENLSIEAPMEPESAETEDEVVNSAEERSMEAVVEEAKVETEEKTAEELPIDLKSEGARAEAEKVAKEEEAVVEVILKEVNKANVDALVQQHGLEKTLEALNELKLIKLRKLAREYKMVGITGRMISKADKKMIINLLRKYYGHES